MFSMYLHLYQNENEKEKEIKYSREISICMTKQFDQSVYVVQEWKNVNFVSSENSVEGFYIFCFKHVKFMIMFDFAIFIYTQN